MEILLRMGIKDDDIKGLALFMNEEKHLQALLKVMEEQDYKMTAQEIYRAGAEIITGKSIEELIKM